MSADEGSSVIVDDGGDAGAATEAVEVAAPTAAPISNVILSHAVLSAIEKMDTTSAFEMMLLNEHMVEMESENKCLKEETQFLKERLAKQTQETSEMYHYFHKNLDQHVAQIAELEKELAAARTEIESLKNEHTETLSTSQSSYERELAAARTESAELREELRQLHAYTIQKRELEARTEELQAEIQTKTQQFAEEKQEIERKLLFEKDRMKKEMLTRMKETKEALLVRTEDQLNTTTKRTMMENDHFMEELSFQSKETERLLERFRLLEDEARRLRVQNQVLEANEVVLTKKNHYYQRILQQLKASNSTVGGGDGSQEMVIVRAKKTEPERVQTLPDGGPDVDSEALRARVRSLEEVLVTAQKWIGAFQREKQFVVAQQDEIIQFLCRTVSESCIALRSRPSDIEKEEDVGSLAKSTTTMGELVTLLPPIAVDELASEDVRFVLQFLLEKMKLYQQQVALVYQQGTKASSRHLGNGRERDALVKQLGVELPPISPSRQVTTSSPLKTKRRVQPQSKVPNEVRLTESTESQDGPGNRPTGMLSSSPGTDQNALMMVVTTSFNFISSPVSPVKSPVSKGVKHGLGGTKGNNGSLKKAMNSTASTSLRERGMKAASNDVDTTRPTGESEPILPSAWSTDSLPRCDPLVIEAATRS
ncbi:hypothetical protein Poli38472_010928 [Pythium oligandrum]|uniref:Cilia- and flagella-associated protein 157 n=1 Tax=Pythium oligandrum TaxID=41045 RepID=A0A8K1CFJ0_PYTOL|nr:hypothetical protein Poli38472_010928 [Pythium oligandrum]|eukprot:TMW61865.1 hypothetical protein Poli38472_010928 [Pythium oligandrum]